jgi:hypothetical protein
VEICEFSLDDPQTQMLTASMDSYLLVYDCNNFSNVKLKCTTEDEIIGGRLLYKHSGKEEDRHLLLVVAQEFICIVDILTRSSQRVKIRT